MQSKRILISVILILLGLGVVAYLLRPAVDVIGEEIIRSERDILPKERAGFNQTILAIDTSDKLIEFINANFIMEPREGLVAHSPIELYVNKKGGAQDFAVFATFVLDQHKYEAGVVRYKYQHNKKGEEKIIVPFRDIDLPKYIFFDDQGANMIHHGWSFNEMFKAEEARLGISITEYAVFNPGVYNLTADQWYQR